MANKLFAGYPQSSGAKQESVIEILGPASYSAIVTGSPPTGGQLIQASQFGLKYIDHVEGSISDDGQYFAVPTYASTGGPVTQFRLIWKTAATGVEVGGGTVLSARTVRLRAIGY